jgi:LysM repeat protein
MDPGRRQQLTRYGAPAAFLAAVTIAVILIQAGLNGGSKATTTIGLFPTASTAAKHTTTKKLVLTNATTPLTGTTTETTTPGAAYYVVQSGDTLGSIAQKYNTTVDELTVLNPGIDPTGLYIGQKIRVK